MKRLSKFLLEGNFIKGKVDITLFVKNVKDDILIIQAYVGDIIFGSTDEILCKEFSNLMQGEFEMSMMGKLTFFLGLQVKQMKEGIFINQAKYTKQLLKKFGVENDKALDTSMNPSIKLDKNENGKPMDEKKY